MSGEGGPALRSILGISALVMFVLTTAPTAAQAQSCKRPMLQGSWSVSCTGSTELYNLVPNTPPGTLVPFAVLGRTVLDGDGRGTSTGIGSIAGNQFAFTTTESFTVNSDCTGERSYQVTIPAFGYTSPSLSGAAVFTPKSDEFKVMPLNPGDVVMCEYKKISPGNRAEQ